MARSGRGLKRETIRTDVLIIGSGVAGLSAAIELGRTDADCVLVGKGPVGTDGGSFCEHNRPWLIQAALALADPSDGPERHLQDILDTSLGMADVELATLLSAEVPESVRRMEALGVKFKAADGRYAQVAGCFCTTPRAVVVEDVEGARRTLVERAASGRVRAIGGVQIVRLLMHDGRCVGAVGLGGGGLQLVILARATILAAGGGGAIYHYHLTGPDATGDGYVLGYEAGAELINLEFVQIVLGIPAADRHAPLPIELLARRPRFLNSRGEPIIVERFGSADEYARALMLRTRHHPFSCRDDSGIIDVGIAKEIMRGRCTRNLGIRVEYEGIESDHPGGLEVAPFARTFNGGLRIDADCATTVANLWAAGEAAGGVHGADVPGGDMLAAAMVFGSRAGRAAAAAALREGAGSFDPDVADQVEAARERVEAARGRDGVEVAEIGRRIGRVLWKKGLVIRNEGGLASALGSLLEADERLREVSTAVGKEADQVEAARAVLSLQNAIALGRLVLRAALNRRESRGAHWREDFPMKDDERFGRPLALSKATVETDPEPEPDIEPEPPAEPETE